MDDALQADFRNHDGKHEKDEKLSQTTASNEEDLK